MSQTIKGTSFSEHTKPATIPVDLNALRLRMDEAIKLLGYALLCLVVGSGGGLIAMAAIPWEGAWNGWRVVFALFGGSVAVLSITLAWETRNISRASWRAFLEWCHLYVDADIAGRTASGNQETTTELTTWELSSSTPRDVLLVALAVHMRVQEGESNAATVRKLRGDLWLGGIRLGDVNSSQAERLSRALAQAGLLGGRGGTSGGTWQPESYDQVVRLVVDNWGKVKD
jgi:hypothetical protein